MDHPNPAFLSSSAVPYSSTGPKLILLAIACSTLAYALLISYVNRPPASAPLKTPSAVNTPPSAAFATIPYTFGTHPQLGNTLTPFVTVPVTVNNHQETITLLFDTGALLTTLPISYAGQFAVNLDSLQRITLSSLTSQTLFGYIAPATITFNAQPISLPLSFAPIDTAVLGRQGILDQYTVIFNHQDQTVSLSGNLN